MSGSEGARLLVPSFSGTPDWLHGGSAVVLLPATLK
jgi:hypothetical protein